MTLGPNLGVFPLEQTRHVGVAKSERPRLTNGEISFEFQPMRSQFTNVTDGQTDDMRSQYRLCTKVHSAVINGYKFGRSIGLLFRATIKPRDERK